MSYLFTPPQKLTPYCFLNTIGNSHSNISTHYDISNEMFTGTYQYTRPMDIANFWFAGFLSEDMIYSCAIFADLDGDMKDGVTNQSE